MSTSDEKASGAEAGEPQKDSDLDFIYCDTQRIGSFLAQFDDVGHLQRVIQRETITSGNMRGSKLNIGGGATVAGTGGSGNIGRERGPGIEGSEEGERIYDPLWTNTRTFLDYLTTQNLIIEDIWAARIGQFVRARGKM